MKEYQIKVILLIVLTMAIPEGVLANCIDPFNKPTGYGVPGRRIDSGTRSACLSQEKPFTILSPRSNQGKTFSEFPTFWLYVPLDLTEMSFTLRDLVTQKVIYQEPIPLDRGDIVKRFQLPKNRPLLKPDRRYRWSFKLLCDSQVNSEVLSLSGIIVRKPIPSKSLERDLRLSSPIEKLQIYLRENVWFDLANELMEFGRTNSQNQKYQRIKKCFWENNFPEQKKIQDLFEWY